MVKVIGKRRGLSARALGGRDNSRRPRWRFALGDLLPAGTIGWRHADRNRRKSRGESWPDPNPTVQAERRFGRERRPRQPPAE